MATNYLEKRPTNHILVGLGGTGGKILRAFKMRMFEEFPTAEERAKLPVALLYVDSTDKEMMGIGRADFDVLGQDASFTQSEFLYIKSVDVSSILQTVDNHPELKGIAGNVNAVKTAIGSLGEAAGQKRRAGRLLFAANADRYRAALSNAFDRCKRNSTKDTRTVHIFAGLCGGTGSGSIVDAIVQARKMWNDGKTKINVYAMFPEKDIPDGVNKGRYYENGYAALNEISALQAGVYKPCDVTDETGMGEYLDLFNSAVKGVANGISVYSNANENGTIVDSFDELPNIVSDYVYSSIFLIDGEDKGSNDILRAYNFENMDDFALELDETVMQDEDYGKEVPAVRTKKVNSFGIKRVVYPELRVLKHITYTVGKSALNQFKYNNWREGLGYTDEEANKDYHGAYLMPSPPANWMLDIEHISQELRVLPSDSEKLFVPIGLYWKERIADFVETCRRYENPLKAIEQQMNTIFNEAFREVGAQKFFESKARSLKEIALEIRHNIESDLFGKWRNGEISVVELVKVSEMLLEYVSDELKQMLDDKINANNEDLAASEAGCAAALMKWKDASKVFNVITNNKEKAYTDFQQELAYLLEDRTKQYAYQFAIQEQQVLAQVISDMCSDIAAFASLLTESIKETSRLISAQAKKNSGLEDMQGAVVEVSEEMKMLEFEQKLLLDRQTMSQMARDVREAIIPNTPFLNFADFALRMNVGTFTHAFDTVLSAKVKLKHDMLPKTATKVLGLNILKQLQQKLDTEQKIQKFAQDILEQSGVFAYIDENEINYHVRNNDKPNNKNIFFSETYISLPIYDSQSAKAASGDPALDAFANMLADAFEKQAKQGQKAPYIYRCSPRKNEILIVTIKYCFPFRALSWMKDYRNRYERYLRTGNANTDLSRRLLLHSEGEGKELPPLFAYSMSQLRDMDAKRQQPIVNTPQPTPQPTPPPPPEPVPVPTPVPVPDPVVNMMLYVGGQQYGPYDYKTLKSFVPTKQITPETLVWQQGMAEWKPASQVEELKGLFAPVAPPPPAQNMPPVPPTPQTPPTPPSWS